MKYQLLVSVTTWFCLSLQWRMNGNQDCKLLLIVSCIVRFAMLQMIRI